MKFHRRSIFHDMNTDPNLRNGALLCLLRCCSGWGRVWVSLRPTCSWGLFSSKWETRGMRKAKESEPQGCKNLSFLCSEIGSGLRHFEGGLISIWVPLCGWCDCDTLEQDCNHPVVKTTSNLFWVFLLPEVTAQYIASAVAAGRFPPSRWRH